MEDKNRLIPDIRPENIQTFTETSGGGQTATYKILEAHPILNGILDKQAFVRTHAAAVWYNRQDNRTVKDEIDRLDGSMLRYTDYNHGTVEIGTGNYTNLTPPGERNYLFATIITFGSTSSPFSVAGYARNFFVIGVKGNAITNLQIRYWYINQ